MKHLALSALLVASLAPAANAEYGMEQMMQPMNMMGPMMSAPMGMMNPSMMMPMMAPPMAPAPAAPAAPAK